MDETLQAEPLRMSEQIADLALALAKAQAQMKPAIRDRTNPHFRSSYADLASVWEACREALTANDIAVVQGPDLQGECVGVTTLLLHKSGQWLSSRVAMVMGKRDPQAVGSAITYARRYGLAAMVGVAPDDDDGEATRGETNGNSKPEPATITPEQAVDLDTLIENVGADTAKLLQFYKVEKLSDLKATDYAQAVRMLEKKRKAS